MIAPVEGGLVTHVALLRGINVGGANVLPMARLRAICDALGWRDVQSYLATGNLIFDADGDASALSAALGGAIRDETGLDVPVLVLGPGDLRRALAECPFAPEDPRRVHACFLFGAAQPDRALFDRLAAEGDGFEIGRGVAWLHTPGGFGRSKLAARLEALLGCAVTARNLRSVAALVEMLDARG